MSDEKRQFAEMIETENEGRIHWIVRIANKIHATDSAEASCENIVLCLRDHYQGMSDGINAAVDRERREAAVKALRQAADRIEPSEIKAGPGGAPGFVQGKEDGLTIAAKYLRARAEIIQRGEQ